MAIAKYRKIIDEVKDSIRAGKLKPDQMLPTTRELCDKYKCSDAVVNHAMTILIETRWVVGHPGSGRCVHPRPPL